MTCKRCNAPLRPGAAFCGKCGSTVEAAPPAVPAGAGSCVCGAPLRADKPFCGRCGRPVSGTTAPAPPLAAPPPEVRSPAAFPSTAPVGPAPEFPAAAAAAPQGSGGKGIILVGGVLLLVAGAGGGWWYYQRGQAAGSEAASTQAAVPMSQTTAPAATASQPAPVSQPGPTEQSSPSPPATPQPAPSRTGGSEPEARRSPVQTQGVQPAQPLPAGQTPVRPIERAPASVQQVAATPQQAAPTPAVQAPPPATAPPVVETPRPPAVRTEPAPQRPQPSVPAAGLLTWSGKLKKNEAVAIDGTGASTGTLQGSLPGVPVMIEIEPKEIGVAEAPGPGNGWRRLVLRSRADRNMVVTIRWQRLGN